MNKLIYVLGVLGVVGILLRLVGFAFGILAISNVMNFAVNDLGLLEGDGEMFSFIGIWLYPLLYNFKIVNINIEEDQ